MFAVNGILFNHESERRGENFVTRKITLAAARIAQGMQDKLYLGNLNALRDWGYAKDYVECMWLILQHDKPEDFVIATGEMHTVREFCTLAFREAGIELEWEGEGVEERGRAGRRAISWWKWIPNISALPKLNNCWETPPRPKPFLAGTPPPRRLRNSCASWCATTWNTSKLPSVSEMNKNSRIFVAGHRGLVGSAIWKSLENKGYSNLIGRTHQELDLEDPAAVREFFDREKPEYVFLAAAFVGGIIANSRYRADFIFRNLQIQQNVIGESFRHGVSKLLFLGSTCIYPREAPQPMKENALLTSPLEYTNEPYAIAKIAGLKMCESFNLQYGTNYIAVMPTNLYGPNDNFHLENSHVLPAMVRKIHLAKCLMEGDWNAVRKDLDMRPVEQVDGTAEEREILAVLDKYGITPGSVELWGTGTPLREFLWSEDMADACVHVMEQVDFSQLQEGGREVRNCHINIGTGKEISIGGLARLIAATEGYRGNLVFNADKPDGTMRKLTDVSRLHSLGWKHRVELEEGVERIYRWYLSRMCAAGN